MAAIDVFNFYRSLLFLILTVYTAAMTAAMVWQAAWLLTSKERTASILRNYLMILFLRAELGPFRREVLQIFGLGWLFLVLLWLHVVFPLPE